MKLIKLMKNKNLKIDIMTAFFNSLSEAAKKNRKIFFITADHGAWAIENLKNILKDRFINIGISEQNMVSVAAGLALQGKKVFIFSITPFVTQRCYEQIKMDICHSKLPVTIIGNGSSLTYAFHGTSHQAVEDIAIMRVLPNLNIFHPFDNLSAKQSVKYCLKSKTPNYVKLDKGFFPLIRKKSNNGFFNFVNNFKKKNILVITTGVITHDVQRLTSELKDKNIYLDILNMFILKPIKKKFFLSIIKKYKLIITIEEQHISGGVGTIVSEIIAEEGLGIKIIKFAINDVYSKKYGDREWLRKFYKIDKDYIKNKIIKLANVI